MNKPAHDRWNERRAHIGEREFDAIPTVCVAIEIADEATALVPQRRVPTEIVRDRNVMLVDDAMIVGEPTDPKISARSGFFSRLRDLIAVALFGALLMGAAPARKQAGELVRRGNGAF